MNGPPGRKEAPQLVGANGGAISEGSGGTASPRNQGQTGSYVNSPKGATEHASADTVTKDHPAVETDGGTGDGRNGAEGAARPLRSFTCPPIVQLHPTNSWKQGANARRIVQMEVSGAIQLYGAEHVGLLTIGCPGGDRIKDVKEFSKRFDSFNSHCLAGAFRQWLAVIQRHKDGTIHAHIVVVGFQPLGAGQYFCEKRRRLCVPPSAHCRGLWDRFNPEKMAGYGLGVANLLPVQDPESCGRYVTRYVARELGSRRPEDRNVRLVRYSQSWRRVVHGPFSWSDWAARRAKHRAQEMGRRLWGSFEAMERDVGAHWKFRLRRSLYCGEEYGAMMTAVERELEFYGGPLFAIDERWARFDQRLKIMAAGGETFGNPGLY